MDLPLRAHLDDGNLRGSERKRREEQDAHPEVEAERADVTTPLPFGIRLAERAWMTEERPERPPQLRLEEDRGTDRVLDQLPEAPVLGFVLLPTGGAEAPEHRFS